MKRLDYFSATELAERHHIPLGQDFHALPWDVTANVARAGKQRGYVKPRNANGSYARCFYEYLNRAAAKRPVSGVTSTPEFQAGLDAQRNGVAWYANPHASGSVDAYEWDKGHTAGRRTAPQIRREANAD